MDTNLSLATPATVQMTVSVEVPAKVAGSGAGATTAPDLDYAGVLSANSTVTAGQRNRIYFIG